jgi:hypothetical protein
MWRKMALPLDSHSATLNYWKASIPAYLHLQSSIYYMARMNNREKVDRWLYLYAVATALPGCNLKIKYIHNLASLQ